MLWERFCWKDVVRKDIVRKMLWERRCCKDVVRKDVVRKDVLGKTF